MTTTATIISETNNVTVEATMLQWKQHGTTATTTQHNTTITTDIITTTRSKQYTVTTTTTTHNHQNSHQNKTTTAPQSCTCMHLDGRDFNVGLICRSMDFWFELSGRINSLLYAVILSKFLLIQVIKAQTQGEPAPHDYKLYVCTHVRTSTQ